jgi:hypothetical protein
MSAANEPRLELRRDDAGEPFAVLIYDQEPPPLFAAIALRSAAAIVSGAGLPLFLSMHLDGVGRRSWRIGYGETFTMTREIPPILRADEQPVEVVQ